MSAATLHPVQQQALWLLLGGGLDEAGKATWLACRFDEGKSVEEIFADALRQMDGQVAA